MHFTDLGLQTLFHWVTHSANLISFPNLTQLPMSKLILQCWVFQHTTSYDVSDEINENFVWNRHLCWYEFNQNQYHIA